MIIKLGTFFTLAELTISGYGTRHNIDNTPPAEAQQCLMDLVHNVLDPLRLAVGRPLVVTSGFRNDVINRAVGGSPTSDHRKGRAADIHQPEMTTRELMRVVIEKKLPFDQVIDEFGQWVHISFRAEKNRNEVLQARHINGSKWYSHLDPSTL